LIKTNLIKKVCADHSLSYLELARITGYGEDTIKKSASSGKISKPLQKAIGLYIENSELKQQVELPKQLKLLLSKIME